jgi:carbon monoxide dehydrogenase subunit G
MDWRTGVGLAGGEAAAALTPLRPTLTVEHRAEVVIGAHPSWLFDQLRDPGAVIACVPGAVLTRALDAQRFEAQVTVGLGPLMMRYAGQGALVASTRGTRRILLSVQGTDTMQTSQARAQLLATVGECTGGAVIRARLNLSVAGSAARFSHRLVRLVTRRLMEQTADRMRGRFEGRRACNSGP